MKKSIFLLMAVPLFLFSCKKDSTHTVQYSTQGTSKSTVTYVDQNGSVQTVANADANWTTTFTSNDNGLLLKLTVVSADGSSIGGKIFIDGKQTAQQNGAAGSVSISATLP
jgi:hypothetical protein